MFDALFTTTTEYKKLSHALSGKGACALFGLPASGRAQVYAALCRQLDKPLCIVTPGEAEATRFAADLNTLGIPAAVFPARDYVLRPIEGTAREYEYRRLAVLGELVGGRLRAVAVPAEALTQFTTPKEDFCANTRTLHAGDTLLRDDLLAALFGAGYTRRAQVDGVSSGVATTPTRVETEEMVTDSATSPLARKIITLEAVPLATLPTSTIPAESSGGI